MLPLAPVGTAQFGRRHARTSCVARRARAASGATHERMHAVRPQAYHGRNGPAQRPDRDRRVHGRRHRDQRPRRRRLRADRGGCCTGGRRGVARPLELAGADERAAAARDPALHRDHPGDGRRRATARDGAAAAGGAAPRPGDGRPQRAVRPPGAAAGVRARRPRLARPTGDLHGGARARDAPAAAQAGADRARRRARDRGGGGAPGAADAETCARVLCALLPRLCANAPTVAEALKALAPRRRSRRGPARRARTGHFWGGAAGRQQPDFARAAHETPACTCSATTRAGCCTSASRSRSAAARGPTSRPSAPPAAGPCTRRSSTTARTRSELGALVLENRLIKELARRATSA